MFKAKMYQCLWQIYTCVSFIFVKTSESDLDTKFNDLYLSYTIIHYIQRAAV